MTSLILLSLTYFPVGISCMTRTSTCFRLGGIYTSLKIWVDISVKWKENFRGYLNINCQNEQNWSLLVVVLLRKLEDAPLGFIICSLLHKIKLLCFQQHKLDISGMFSAHTQ